MSFSFKSLLDLQQDEAPKEQVLQNIKANISFKGANIWILACAIVVASVGLNVNSTAVIIGAMLISPLMGPIVGTGFALGIYDFQLFKQSGRNLIIATVVSLTVSFIYFFISPFKDAQSELLARTAPNIYDVLIAFFGGLVGVIALTRVEKGNPIPGVAIATALMPPLCTTGYGLATGNFAYAAGAFYLYCINCIFICLATLVIVKYLHYPHKVELDIKKSKRIRMLITIIISVVILPSIYFAYTLWKEKQFYTQASLFIDNEMPSKGVAILNKTIVWSRTQPLIELRVLAPQVKIDSALLHAKAIKMFGNEIQFILDIQQTKSLEENDTYLPLIQKFPTDLDILSQCQLLFPDLLPIQVREIYNITDSTVGYSGYAVKCNDSSLFTRASICIKWFEMQFPNTPFSLELKKIAETVVDSLTVTETQ